MKSATNLHQTAITTKKIFHFLFVIKPKGRLPSVEHGHIYIQITGKKEPQQIGQKKVGYLSLDQKSSEKIGQRHDDKHKQHCHSERYALHGKEAFGVPG